jgi:uncharacterized protein (DUF1330 family)
MKGYLVIDLSIKVLDEFLGYAEKIPTFVEKHGGRYIVQGVVPERMEGDWIPERLVIIEFPSTQKAKDFLADPEAQGLKALRHSSTDSHVILAEGCF